MQMAKRIDHRDRADHAGADQESAIPRASPLLIETLNRTAHPERGKSDRKFFKPRPRHERRFQQLTKGLLPPGPPRSRSVAGPEDQIADPRCRETSHRQVPAPYVLRET